MEVHARIASNLKFDFQYLLKLAHLCHFANVIQIILRVILAWTFRSILYILKKKIMKIEQKSFMNSIAILELLKDFKIILQRSGNLIKSI